MAKPDNSAKIKEFEEKEAAEDGLKFVIDGAKIKCDLCTVPIGDLKVNYDTPSIQDKPTATVVEKDQKSLIFKGNCKKSPYQSSPCASVMKLADWKNPGTVYFQDELPILQRSTIKCEYGGTDIKITDSGQRNVITNLDTTGAPVPSFEEPAIIDIKWMCSEMENTIIQASIGENVSLLVKTINFKEGEIVTIIVDELNGKDLKVGTKEITYSGEVNAEGIAELKQKIEL